MKSVSIKKLNYNGKSASIGGSKSDTNRALILAALSEGKTSIMNFSKSDDSRIMIENLTLLGVGFEYFGNDLLVTGTGGKFQDFFGKINIGIAGTTCRFLLALCIFVKGDFVFCGERKMLERPIGILLEALIDLGIEVEYLGKVGCLPLRIHNSKTSEGGVVNMDGGVSSQFFSALLLIGGSLEHGIIINVTNKLVSESYVNMTLSTLQKFGINSVVNRNKDKEIVNFEILSKQQPFCQNYLVETDFSSCSYFFGLSPIHNIPIRIPNCDLDSNQGDKKFLGCLEVLGCNVNTNSQNNIIEVTPPIKMQGDFEFDMGLMPDVAQTLAIVSCFVDGKVKLTGLATLRVKETDRILAMSNELRKLGIEVEYGEDWLIISGKDNVFWDDYEGRDTLVAIDTYDDHRMAMSFAMIGLARGSIVIDNPNVVTKSFVDYWDVVQSIGGEIEFFDNKE